MLRERSKRHEANSLSRKQQRTRIPRVDHGPACGTDCACDSALAGSRNSVAGRDGVESPSVALEFAAADAATRESRTIVRTSSSSLTALAAGAAAGSVDRVYVKLDARLSVSCSALLASRFESAAELATADGAAAVEANVELPA